MNVERQFNGFVKYIDSTHYAYILPEGEDFGSYPQTKVEYFKKYGFKVPAAYSHIYEKYNGIKSEKYIPVGLYYYTIYPYLCNLNLTMAYADKNNYERLFPNVLQPQTIFKCMGGMIFDSEYNIIEKSKAINLLFSKDKFVIKPSIESGCGKGVSLVRTLEYDENKLGNLLDEYESNYIVQDVFVCHPAYAAFNRSSLNTCRVYTYRDIDSLDLVVLGTVIRFGGEGATKDNACAGGGFCKVELDGSVCDRIFQYGNYTFRSLKEEKGLADYKLPFFDKVVNLSLSMHRTLPYMNLVGWDISVDTDGNPVLIELNQYPDCELIQISHGPMFGEYTDSIMEHVKGQKITPRIVFQRSYEGGPKQYEYNIDIEKNTSL